MFVCPRLSFLSLSSLLLISHHLPFTTSILTPSPLSSPSFPSLSPGVFRIYSHLTLLSYFSFLSGVYSTVTATSPTSKGPV